MLTNKDIELLIKIEHLVGDNLTELLGETGEWDGRKGLNEFYKDDPTFTFNREDFNDFWNLIEREIKKKRTASIKANEWNKAHKERHNKSNKLSYARTHKKGQ